MKIKPWTPTNVPSQTVPEGDSLISAKLYISNQYDPAPKALSLIWAVYTAQAFFFAGISFDVKDEEGNSVLSFQNGRIKATPPFEYFFGQFCQIVLQEREKWVSELTVSDPDEAN